MSGGGPERATVLRARGLRVALGGRTVLAGVDLEVREGETLCILGASGAGKSVTLRCLAGLATADAGTVELFGRDLASLGPRELNAARRDVGFLFQSGALIGWMTVRDNVALPLRENERLSAAEIDARVGEALAEVGLAADADKLPAELSGGMRKRAGLARALVRRPRLLLLDEPTSGLDPVTSRAMDRHVQAVARAHGLSQVVVSHDLPGALLVGDRLALLHDGRMVFSGAPAEWTASDEPAVVAFRRAAEVGRNGAPPP